MREVKSYPTRQDRDLFGAPLVMPRGRGRPAFNKTAENQWLVVAMLRAGCTRDEIATKLGISLPTLRRHFFEELYGKDQA